MWRHERMALEARGHCGCATRACDDVALFEVLRDPLHDLLRVTWRRWRGCGFHLQHLAEPLLAYSQGPQALSQRAHQPNDQDIVCSGAQGRGMVRGEQPGGRARACTPCVGGPGAARAASVCMQAGPGAAYTASVQPLACSHCLLLLMPAHLAAGASFQPGTPASELSRVQPVARASATTQGRRAGSSCRQSCWQRRARRAACCGCAPPCARAPSVLLLLVSSV